MSRRTRILAVCPLNGRSTLAPLVCTQILRRSFVYRGTSESKSLRLSPSSWSPWMVASATGWLAVTNAPLVTDERPILPEIGAVTLV